MRDKNVRRAAHALFLSQGDDKNDKLGDAIKDKIVRRIVKDQGRALIILEKLILPKGKDAYSEEEMYAYLTKKLTKKGHRIQDDESEDTPEYAEEKRRYDEARALRVPNFFELAQIPEPEVKPDSVQEPVVETKPESILTSLRAIKESLKAILRMLK